MFDSGLLMPRFFGISLSNHLDVDGNGYPGENECLSMHYNYCI